MLIDIIYSETIDHIIGIHNDLFCRVPNDLKYFKKVTSLKKNDKRNVLITGYNTWISLPGHMKKSKVDDSRDMIVISKNHVEELNKEGVNNYSNIEECFLKLKEENIYGKIFIIGGSQLYRSVVHDHFSKINLIYQTKINEEVNLNEHVVVNPIIITDYIHKNEVKLIKSDKYKSIGLIYTEGEYREKMIEYEMNVYQNSNTINSDEYQYLNLLTDILNEKNVKNSRNGNVYSSFGTRMVFDLRDGFPLLTTKKMPWKTVLRELLWFINGSTDNKLLQEKKVHIWDQNASKEFLDTRGLEYEEGNLGPIYGFQWRHFGAEYIDHKTDYEGKGVDQLEWIINEIKTNPTSRRLIMSAWNPVDLDKMALPPCHLMVQFNIDGEYIDAQLYQRSGDMFLGVPFNIASYSFLLTIIGKITNYIPRKLYHIIGDSHIYENHIDSVKTQCERIPLLFPKLILQEIDDINQLNEEMFSIKEYIYEPTIKAKMIM